MTDTHVTGCPTATEADSCPIPPPNPATYPPARR
jgi:hypothetical protein